MENVTSDIQQILNSPYAIILQSCLAIIGLVLVIRALTKKGNRSFLVDTVPAIDSGWRSIASFILAYLLASFFLGFVIGFILTIAGAIIFGPENCDQLGFSYFITIITVPFVYLITCYLWKIFTFKDDEAPALSINQVSLGQSITKGLYYYCIIFFYASIAHFAFLTLVDLINLLGANIVLTDQEITAELLKLHHPASIAVFLLFTTILIPIAEEVIFRAGLYRILKSKIGIHAAIGISSLIFAAIHVTLSATPTLLVVGIVLCYAYEKTGSIKVPILIHIFNNIVAMSFVFLP